MPGWYIHLDVAETVAEILMKLNNPGITGVALEGEPISSFQNNGPTPQDLANIINKYPNYYALGAIGPDIFFLLPDFRGKTGNFIARLAEWVIDFYNTLDEKVLKPWQDIMGPIEEDSTEELSRLTGGLSDEISRISNYASGIITDAVLGFLTRLYDWFSLFGTGVSEGYDDHLFFWSDMFHYRRTNEFARDLFERARTFSYDEKGGLPFTSGQGDPFGYEQGIAFALGWMTHIGTDVTGHAFVNEKAGGPYRLHWQRHHLVENHMDAFVYNDQHGKQDRYNMLANSALHFWVQFNKQKNNEADYNYFDEKQYRQNPSLLNSTLFSKHFPDYPTGLKARDYFERKKAFDVDSNIPLALANFLLDTMKVTFYDRHKEENNDDLPTHPMILAAITQNADGRPDLDLMQTTYALLYNFIKYTTTDYYKMPKPQPPDVFPNLDPPLPPGSSDDAPGSNDDSWDFWKALLAIFAWILYVVKWIEYLVSILPAIILDLATYPARYLLYLFEEALYELWKAFRFLLVMEGFIMPEPDEIDLGLIQLGMPSKGPYQGLLAIMNDVFGGLLGDNPNPIPLSEPVNDPLYPRQSVMDEPGFLSKFIKVIEDIAGTGCGLPEKCNPRQPSEFLRPWEYPLKNNDHTEIGIELGHTRASPHVAGSLPTVLLGQMPGNDQARHSYEQASTTDDTDQINATRLNERWNMGNPIFYSLYVMGQLTRDGVDPTEIASFNLDADRGYGYKCWDWDRHEKLPTRPSVIMRNPWKPPHWFVSESASSADGPFSFKVARPQTDAWLDQHAPGKSLEERKGTLLSPVNIATVLLAYGGNETAMWKDIISKEIEAHHPLLKGFDLVDQWIDLSYVEATGIVTHLTHPNALPWSISNSDLSFNHTTMPFEPGQDDEGDTQWRSYTSYDYATEGDDDFKAARLAAHTHLIDPACTASELSQGDWYYRDREFPLFLDLQYLDLLSSGNCDEGDLQGCLGIEGESWQLDKQVMPWLGDRMFVAGQWIIDNGHSKETPPIVRKHLEIHPPFVVVRHFQVPVNAPFNADRSGATASSEAEAAVDIVVFVTGAWRGGSIEWDVFPPVRTDAAAVAQVQAQVIAPDTFEGFAPHSAQYQNSPDIKIEAIARGNHIHFTVTAPVVNPQPATFRLGQYGFLARRYIAAYRISWTSPIVIKSERTIHLTENPLSPARIASLSEQGFRADITIAELLTELARQQIKARYDSLGGNAALGDPMGDLEKLQEKSRRELDNDPCPQFEPAATYETPEDQVPRESVTVYGYRQRYSNGSALIWSSRAGAILLSKRILAVWDAFYGATGRLFFPTADAADTQVAFGVDSYGNAASLEIGEVDNNWYAYIAMYDDVGDVLTGQKEAIARYNNDPQFEYRIPCTPPEQFDKNDTCGTGTSPDIPLDYDPTIALRIHYLALLKEGEHYPGCEVKQPAPSPPPIG